MEKINLKTIEKYQNLKCPRCNSKMFFDLLCITENSLITWGVISRCCGSDFKELTSDWGL